MKYTGTNLNVTNVTEVQLEERNHEKEIFTYNMYADDRGCRPDGKTTTEATIADKKDEKKKPVSATGVYNGFGDSNSVEVKMSNGEYKTFIIEDEKVMDALNDMEPGTKISFTYGALEGQANMQILSVKKK